MYCHYLWKPKRAISSTNRKKKFKQGALQKRLCLVTEKVLHIVGNAGVDIESWLLSPVFVIQLTRQFGQGVERFAQVSLIKNSRVILSKM